MAKYKLNGMSHYRTKNINNKMNEKQKRTRRKENTEKLKFSFVNADTTESVVCAIKALKNF